MSPHRIFTDPVLAAVSTFATLVVAYGIGAIVGTGAGALVLVSSGALLVFFTVFSATMVKRLIETIRRSKK